MIRRIRGAEGPAVDVRELLRQWGLADQRRAALSDRLSAAKRCLDRVSPWDGDDAAPSETAAVPIMAARRRVREARELLSADAARCAEQAGDLTRLNEAMTSALNRLVLSERRVVELRYRRRLTWVAIGARLGVDESYARRLERHAVARLSALPQLQPFIHPSSKP